jgi:hypothetical protein
MRRLARPAYRRPQLWGIGTPLLELLWAKNVLPRF